MEQSYSSEEVDGGVEPVAVMELAFDLGAVVASRPFAVAFVVELVAGGFAVGGVESFRGRVGNVVVVEVWVGFVVAVVVAAGVVVAAAVADVVEVDVAAASVVAVVEASSSDPASSTSLDRSSRLVDR
jgi:hypothetical protein